MTGRRWKIPVLRKIGSAMDVGPVDGRRVRTNEDMGRRGALQAACWETMEEFRRVAGQRKVARVDSARELAEGEGDAQETDGLAARGLTGPYWRLVGPWGTVQSTPLIRWCDQCLA